jgi:nicotinamide-nucleotide adenylyltransferase
MKALFIGRFQPFHNGHLQVIQSIAATYDEIIIGIGSAQYSHTLENPFTAEERKQMIQETLTVYHIHNYSIIEIPDINNLKKWVTYVSSRIPSFNVVISNSELTQQLFSEKGYLVKGTPSFDRTHLSGYEIRKRIKENNPWESFVPQPVIHIIKKINGVKRIQSI